MRIGRFQIEQLSEGIFDVYTGGVITKIDAHDITSPPEMDRSRHSATTIGINPILIRDGKQVVIIDTGLGWGLDHKSEYEDTSNLITNLDIFGISPSDVTHVVLSHLHFDHAAGSTYVDESSSTQPTLPNANYFLQKKEWHYALQQLGEPAKKLEAGYKMDEMYKLAADDKLVMITDTSFELLPGIELIRTGGHTPGHQIVKIYDSGEYAYFLGDLIPSEHQLNYSIQQMHVDPLQSKKAKTLILKQALKEKAYLLFYHSIHVKAGRLERTKNKKFGLKEIKP
ncbi:MAG: MBL fold metallo-hydrolase [Balneolaceae bacterium]|nr:MBL fold metallo-hydrolase [Balneolaceae bacterium]